MNTGLRALLLVSLALSFALAQSAPEITSQQAPLPFRGGVNLVSVPVVVRDSKGTAIGSLRQEDFRLFDKGKLQTITEFSVEHNTPAASFASPAGRQKPVESGVASPLAPPDRLLPQRYVAYVFDDIHLNSADLARVRAIVSRHFAESPGLASRAAIYTTSGRVTLDFTNDRDRLEEALARIGPGPSAVQAPDVKCPPGINDYEANLIVNGDTQALAAGVQEVLRCYPGIPDPASLARGLASKALAANHKDTVSAFDVVARAVERLSVMPGSRSIVLLSPGFMIFDDARPQEMGLTDRAIHANVVINGFSAPGVYTPGLGDAARSNEPFDSLRMRYRLAGADAAGAVMADLAAGTGGAFFHNDNGLAEGLNRLATPPEYEYILGFSPQNLKLDGSYHSLKVALVTAKGLDLQARRGYWAPNHAIDPEEQSRQEIEEAVFSLDEIRDLPVDVSTEFFKTSDIAAELTVESHLDLKSLSFRQAGDRSDDTLTVVTALFDQDGHYVKGVQRVIALRLREQTLERLLNSGITDKQTFEIAPGDYVVRVVVRDSEGQLMAARNDTVKIQ